VKIIFRVLLLLSNFSIKCLVTLEYFQYNGHYVNAQCSSTNDALILQRWNWSLLGDVLVLFHECHHAGMIGNNNGKVLFLFLFWVGYHGGIIGHNTIKVLFLFLILVYVLGRSQMIELIGIYSEDCSRKHIRWFLVWIHVANYLDIMLCTW